MNESNSDSNKSPKTKEKVRTPAEIVKFAGWEKWMLGLSYFVLVICYSIILIQLLHCVPSKISGYLYSWCSPFLVPNPCLTYIALISAILAWLVHFLIWKEKKVYKLRLEDSSEVMASIIEAKTAEKRLIGKIVKPDNLDTKLQNVINEAKRLEALGDKNWTDYQILTLNVMLVDFLKPDDLKARARASLEDLQDYCENRVDRFEEDSYESWRKRIRKGCEEIDRIERRDDEKDEEYLKRRDDASRQLRANLRMLLERLSDYDKHWSEGSAVLAAIIKCGVTTLPHFLGIGLLPLLYISLEENLSFYNMAALGVCGSITAVLITLHQRYGSNEAEVGATKGRTQLWLSILGTTLGLVAGIVFYAMVKGKLLDGNLFPEFPPKNLAVDVMCTGKSGHEILLTGETYYATKTLQCRVQEGGISSDDNGGAECSRGLRKTGSEPQHVVSLEASTPGGVVRRQA